MQEKSKKIFTKEEISARMFKQSAKFWGHSDANIDNFDPLVRLIIEACANEVYKLNNELETIEERLLSKIAKILSPQAHTEAKPAHAILHARSTDTFSYIKPYTQFFHHKKIASKPNGPIDSNIDIFFSPLINQKIVDGKISFIANGNNINSYNEYLQKEEHIHLNKNNFESNVAWLGVDFNNAIKDLTDICFFFDLKNTYDASNYYSTLPYLKAFINNTELQLISGLPISESKQGEELTNEYYNNTYNETRIRNHYKNQFLTISKENKELTNISDSSKRKYPTEFEDVLTAQELKTFTKDLVWIKFVFTPNFDSNILENLYININCFPIVNRHLNEITYRLQSYFNIIPLVTTEQFLTIDKVEGATEINGSKNYFYYPFDKFDQTKKGSYAVRSGNVERFDSRNATEYLNYLLELLRDESGAFAAIGQDFIASLIKELNQNITQIEQKVKQNIAQLNFSPSYLLINPSVEGDTIFAKYYTTNGDVANGIRSGNKLDLYEGSDVAKDSIMLMTNTIGGSDALKSTETLQAYRNVLISRGRLVTMQDIHSFCAYFLQNKAKKFEIKQGVGISSKPAEGLIQTIDITINPQAKEYDNEEWQGIQTDLKNQLEMQSAINMNYRIFLN